MIPALNMTQQTSNYVLTVPQYLLIYIHFTRHLTQSNSYLQLLLGQSALWSPSPSPTTKELPPEFVDNYVGPLIIKEEEEEPGQISTNFTTSDYVLFDYPHPETQSTITNTKELKQQSIREDYKSKLRCPKIAKIILQKVDLIPKVKIEPGSSKSRSTSKSKSKFKCIYPCKECINKSFPSLLQLKYHTSAVHHTSFTSAVVRSTKSNPRSRANRKPSSGSKFKKTYACSECNMTFNSRSSYYYHRITTVHTGSGFTYSYSHCSSPPAVFPTQDLLNYHLVMVHDIGPKLPDRTCPACNKYYPTPYRMSQHLRTTHIIRHSYACPVCPTKFSFASQLENHLKQVHEPKGLNLTSPEPNCTKSFKSQTSYRKHLKAVHEPNPPIYTCNICGKTSNNPSFLRLHLPTHSAPPNDELLQCDKCPKKFKSNRNLRVHIRNVHNDKEARLRCTECGISYKNRKGLTRHIRLNHWKPPQQGERGSLAPPPPPVICSLCGKSFKVNHYLRQHLKSKAHGGPGTNPPDKWARIKAKQLEKLQQQTMFDF